MTRRERLIENYENAGFALLIDSVATKKGKQLIEENNALKESEESLVPESFIQRCLSTIKRAFSRNQRRETIRTGFKILNRVAVAAVITMVLFTTAYAAFPEVRIRTLNLLIEISDVSASLTLVDQSEGNAPPENRSPDTEGHTLMGYSIPEMPEGFVVIDEGSDRFSTWIKYEDELGNWMQLSVIIAERHSIDTEESDYLRDISINGFDALQIQKHGRIHIAWADTTNEYFIELITFGIDEAITTALAQQICFVES